MFVCSLGLLRRSFCCFVSQCIAVFCVLFTTVCVRAPVERCIRAVKQVNESVWLLPVLKGDWIHDVQTEIRRKIQDSIERRKNSSSRLSLTGNLQPAPQANYANRRCWLAIYPSTGVRTLPRKTPSASRATSPVLGRGNAPAHKLLIIVF